ncbi:MAG: tetratricopeptide repeat protein [Gallionella sp.]|nr:tetratricopeptide repeat protein [Gallionella sp.]
MLGNFAVLGYLIVLAILPSILYGSFLTSPLVFDDPNVINSATLQFFTVHPFAFQLRWFPYASFGWTEKLLGLDLGNFRIANLLLHIAVCWVLFLFLRRLYSIVLAQVNLKVSVEILAFGAALVFALHPIAVYGVAYLVERSIVMATLMVLLMLVSWQEGVIQGRVRWFYFAAVFYTVALFSKEHSVMAPVLCVALTILLGSRARQLFSLGMLAPLMLMGVSAGMVLLASKGVVGNAYEINASDMLKFIAQQDGESTTFTYPLSVLSQGFLFFKYVVLWLIPSPGWMSVDMREPLAMSFWSWPHTIGFVFFVFYPFVALAFLFRRGGRGILGFGLLFPFVLFATELVAMRLQEPFVLYRSYLWMIGLVCIFPLLLLQLRAAMVWPVLIAVGFVLVIGAWDRLITFSSPMLLWQDAANLVEGKPYQLGAQRIYYNRGNSYFFAKKYPEALADYSRAVASGERAGVYFGLQGRGNIYFHLRQYDLALADFDELVKQEPGMSIGYYGRGRIYEELGNKKLSQQDYKISCALGQRGCERLLQVDSE